MTEKLFVSPEQVRDNGIKLANKIHNDGFIPDVIYVSLRGGAHIGNVISEYFKLIPRKRPVLYAAVVARSYNTLNKNIGIVVDGWTYNPKHLRGGDKVLLVDDIFDSGRTLNHLGNIILKQGIPASDFRVAVHDYKMCSIDKMPTNGRARILPKYWCRKYDPDHPSWIHYLSHEIVGLDTEEIHCHYENPEIRDILNKVLQNTKHLPNIE